MVDGEINHGSGYKIDSTKLLQNPKNITYKNLLKNTDDMFKYGFNYLLSGKTFEGKDISVGSNYFIKSGKCDNQLSDEACKNQDRHIYLRNISIGKIPPFSLSFEEATGCNLQGLTEMRGIVPGLIEDIYDINPVEIGIGINGNGNLGSKVCKKMKLPVGSKIYDPNKYGNTWKYDTKCTSSHNNMIKTNDQTLNREIINNNLNIEDAKMPASYQMVSENFTSQKNTNNVYYFIFLFILLTIVVTILCYVFY